MKILQEGRNRKFIREVEHLTYSTKYAEEAGQKVIYVTERAVFEYRDGRLVLTEMLRGSIWSGISWGRWILCRKYRRI